MQRFWEAWILPTFVYIRSRTNLYNCSKFQVEWNFVLGTRSRLKCTRSSLTIANVLIYRHACLAGARLHLNMNADGFLLEFLADRPDLVCHHGGRTRIAPFGVRVSPTDLEAESNASLHPMESNADETKLSRRSTLACPIRERRSASRNVRLGNGSF